jgi:hypothetical protein
MLLSSIPGSSVRKPGRRRPDRRNFGPGGVARLSPYAGNEAVATPANGFYVTRLFRRVLERIAQPLHSRVDAVLELHNRVVGPEFPTDLLTQQHFPRILQQIGKYSKGLVLQADLLTVLAQLAGSQIEFKVAKTNEAIRGSAAGARVGRFRLRKVHTARTQV